MRSLFATRLAVLAIGLAFAGSAAAQSTRTWVSGVGDDVNSCTRTAPCKTFAGAISKTTAGGEIDALDSGGFGTVTITKSITIDGGAKLASVLASNTFGINVNAGPLDVVVLRRLSIAGIGSGTTGIRFLAGAALHVQDSQVTGFAQGIVFTPAAGGQLYASNVEVSDNNTTNPTFAPNAGIVLSSLDATKPSIATLTRVRLSRNGGVGLLVQGNARASVYDSVAGGNASAGVSAAPTGTATAEINLENVVLSSSPVGIQATTPAQGSALIRFSKVVALDVGASVQTDANTRLVSFGNNRFLDQAPGPGNFAVAAAPGHPAVKAGKNVQLTVTVAPGAGFTGSVTLACANLPAGASCSFTPATVSLTGAPVSTMLTVSTSGAAAMLGAFTRKLPAAPNPVWPLGACMMVFTWRAGTRRRIAHGAPRLLPWAALCAAVLLTSCSGGSTTHRAYVLPGTYVFQVTGTAPDTTVSNLATVTLTVSR